MGSSFGLLVSIWDGGCIKVPLLPSIFKTREKLG